MSELHELTAFEQVDLLRRGKVSPLDLVDHYLARIERLDSGPDGLGAFVEVTADTARERAAAILAEPRAAALWGLPSADKDLVDRAGVPTRYGSRAFADHVPEKSDELIEVLDDAGAISLGKTNTPEFGMPSYTEPVSARPARNPYDTTLGAGGSSGGAAVAVAAGLLPVAPGSDGGGSVRIPAAATGLVGLKPSRGRIPASPGFTSLGGLGVAGPLARTVTDAALLFDAMIGDGRLDYATQAPSWDGGAYLNAAIRGEGRFQLGVTTSSPWETAYELTVEPEAHEALRIAREHLDAIGHGLEEFALEPEEGYAPAFVTLWQGGAAGIRIEGEQLDQVEPLTRWLVETGRGLGARELAAALGWLTKYERRLIRQLSRFDAVLTPTLAMTPRPIGWYDAGDAMRNFGQQVQYTPFTSFVNVSGLPAITLPVHVTEGGLPMGVQLIGRPGGEDVLLSIGAQLERRLNWHERHPPQW
ncbi:MAG TPA: amidase [Pseudolysinimonas sp.]